MEANRLTFWVILTICAFSFTFGQQNVIELTENNWQEMLQGEWMVEFFAPWCPACKGLQPIWKDFAYWASSSQVKVAQVDVTNSPGLSGRFMVTALPTIFHVLDGEFRQYKGTRDKAAFSSFIKEKKWQAVEPIPGWKSPNSVQMTVVSSFFKLSQILRSVHNQLLEDFGMPTWGSYLIFAIATIFLGALLGLVLVCVIDLVYPPKSAIASKSGKKQKADKSSDDELADEDIKDDLYDDATSHTDVRDSSDKSETDSKPSSPTIQKRKSRKAD